MAVQLAFKAVFFLFLSLFLCLAWSQQGPPIKSIMGNVVIPTKFGPVGHDEITDYELDLDI